MIEKNSMRRVMAARYRKNLASSMLYLCVLTQFPTNLVAQIGTQMDFSPHGYLSEKYSSESTAGANAIKISEVNLGGSGYVKYEHKLGTLYVEKVTRPDVDPKIKLHCIGLDNQVEVKEQRITVERSITDDVSVDLSLVTNLFMSRCDGEILGMSPAVNPLEIGVKVKSKDGQYYRIFNRMLKPNIGFQTEF